jgi:hypothetical protein
MTHVREQGDGHPSQGGTAEMQNTHSLRGNALAVFLGAIGGGLGVALATRAIPRMMSQLMSGMMRNMMAQMGEDGCDPAEM